MRTCNTFTVGVCWASNLHFFTQPPSLFFLFISLFCHSFPPSICSNRCILGLFTWFSNYANDCVWFRILVQSAAFPQLTQGFPQLIPVSAANPGFRSCFIKRYVPGVLREEEPHGQVRGTKDMVCVPPDHPNQSSKPVVNEEATSINIGHWRWHGSACSVLEHVKNRWHRPQSWRWWET